MLSKMVEAMGGEAGGDFGAFHAIEFMESMQNSL